ncbi:MAG: hypothetical protein NVSMB23_25550 [Myxococcales bacterium]
MQTIPRARLVLPTALLLGLAACVINLNFDIPRTFTVDVPTIVSGSFTQQFAVDFSQQPEVQQHKGSIDSLSLDSLDLTVSQVDTAAGKNTLQSIASATVALRPDGATDATKDVAVGTLTNFAIAVGTTAHLKGSPALDAFMLQAVKGTGKFSIVLGATTNANGGAAAAHFVLQATMHAGLGYNTGIF